MKKFWVAPIIGYQYISQMLPAGCRYYPTCSEYAKWSFEMEHAHMALYHSTLRILSCNQLFAGGIDYPVVAYKRVSFLTLTPYLNIICGKMKIKYWIVPKIDAKNKKESKNRYYIIKDHNAY